MLLHGDGPAGPVVFPDAFGHELVVCRTPAPGAGLARQSVAESVDHEDRLRVDEIRDKGPYPGGITVVVHVDVFACFDAHFSGAPGVDPQHILRHPLVQQGIVDRMPLGVQGAPPKRDAEPAPWRTFWRHVRLERGLAVFFQLCIDYLDLAGQGLEGAFPDRPVERLRGQ